MAGCDMAAREDFEKAAAELPAAEAEARRLGVPLHGSDLEPNPPVTAAENAAPLLREASDSWGRLKKDGDRWIQDLEAAVADPNQVNLDKADAALKGLQAPLDLAAAAAKKPRSDFQRGWGKTEPLDMMFPEFGPLKSLVKGLSCRGSLRALRGDTEAALQDYSDAMTLARFAGSDPVLIAGLVQVACSSIVVRQMEYAAASRPKDVAMLTALQRLAADTAANPMDMRHALRGEAFMGSSINARGLKLIADGSLTPTQDESDGGAKALLRSIFPQGVSQETLIKAYRARSLQFWNGVFEDAAIRRDPLALTARLEKSMEKVTFSKDPTMAMNKFLLPVFSQAGTAFARREAYLATFQGLTAVLRFRAENGRDPRTLEEASFSGTDPFSRGPYRMKIVGAEVRVYSVGPNGKDDGGKEVVTGPDRDRTGTDIVSVYPRRAKG